jgi:hypothetical protein
MKFGTTTVFYARKATLAKNADTDENMLGARESISRSTLASIISCEKKLAKLFEI